MMSGLPIENFREGWALRLFTWGKVHYWRSLPDRIGVAKSLCGYEVATRWPTRNGKSHPAMMEPGDWTRCKACQRLADKQSGTFGHAGRDHHHVEGRT